MKLNARTVPAERALEAISALVSGEPVLAAELGIDAEEAARFCAGPHEERVAKAEKAAEIAIRCGLLPPLHAEGDAPRKAAPALAQRWRAHVEAGASAPFIETARAGYHWIAERFLLPPEHRHRIGDPAATDAQLAACLSPPAVPDDATAAAAYDRDQKAGRARAACLAPANVPDDLAEQVGLALAAMARAGVPFVVYQRAYFAFMAVAERAQPPLSTES